MKNNTIVWIILGIVVLFLIGSFGFSSYGGMMGWGNYGMMNNYWTGAWGFMWLFMIVIGILVIIALVLGIIWLAKQIQKK